MIAEVWEDKEGTTLIEQNDPNKKILVLPDAKLIRTINGEDWNDCAKKHYELMGWEPYKPFED